jgi:Holliday junction DNA helicase RuvB
MKRTKERLVDPQLRDENKEDEQVDYTFRPRRLKDFIGQDKVKEKIDIFIQAARSREEALEHVLLVGPKGLGKTTLAHIIANELNVNIRSTVGPALERLDLSAILTNLQDGDVLFIDEIHRMKPIVQESLYPAMEDYKLDVVIGQGPSARIVPIPLPRFTLIGATTREGLLAGPFRDRFGIVERLDFYTAEELQIVVNTDGRLLSIQIDDGGSMEIARRSRGTMRLAKTYLRRIRDIAFSQNGENCVITKEVAQRGLKMLDVDEMGLHAMDRAILKVIIEKFGGGPVGLNTISVAVSEEENTIEDVYEPYLIKIGFINRTRSGRVATKLAYQHLGIPYPVTGGGQTSFWE